MMKKTALKIFLAAVLFVVCSGVFYYVGENAERSQVTEEVSILSDGGQELTVWHHASAGLMFAAMPLLIASALVCSRNREDQ
jgi:hypothetical protein